MPLPAESEAEDTSTEEARSDDGSESTQAFVREPEYLCYNLICLNNVE